ncbi:anti-sigma factor family protein [Aliikangiella coralliicola]|uniref:Putative zinc-finger domain-containing protein n=1 Tax=Aliikangiella coralliicola TaxID=2592383 RepID=A0A545UK01_9GAMM|nr:zf-HC2 domain-containing protein [Aliikangiella coralliicola]TQV89773.1 hypothetical protein FLL46_02515 [Aliikangiella coralliicola]
MLCDHQLVSDHLLDYIDEKLSPAVRKQVEQALDNCETCQSCYQQAIALHQAAHQWKQEPVPEWHRTEYAVRPRQRQPGWLNWAAMATSTLAILMVIFQVQFSVNDSGFNIAFGNQSNQQVNTLIEEKLNEYKKQQALLIEARFVAQSDKQATANQLLVANLLEKTREERRDDLNFLVTGIQSQRFEDQRKVEKRLASLTDNQIENNQYINQLIQSANFNKGDDQ